MITRHVKFLLRLEYHDEVSWAALYLHKILAQNMLRRMYDEKAFFFDDSWCRQSHSAIEMTDLLYMCAQWNE